MLGRIQTRDNLLKRQVIHTAAEALCPLCGRVEESCSHLLFTCPAALLIWYDVYAWLGVSTAQIPVGEVHLLQFASIGSNKSQKLGEVAIWLTVVWSLWCVRNRIVFSGGELLKDQILEQVQLKSWQWLTARRVEFSYSWFEWKSNPRLCLLSL
ncbi:uncharacterized protein LOC130714100 [Lotus japonicus]|nr:uncharacterized protein LOC130714100 [Lotus japonicus]